MINKASNLFANVKTHICSINIQFYQKATFFFVSLQETYLSSKLTLRANLTWLIFLIVNSQGHSSTFTFLSSLLLRGLKLKYEQFPGVMTFEVFVKPFTCFINISK